MLHLTPKDIITLWGLIEERGDLLTAFWTAALSLETLGLLWIGYYQLSKFNKTTSADFIHRFTNDFFTDQNRELISLIDNGLIEFKDGNRPYFEVRHQQLTDHKLKEKLGLAKISGICISAYAVDDLLGHFEDLGLLEQGGVINLEMVYEGFGYYLNSCWNAKEIKKYVKYQRKDGDGDIHDKFENIYYRSKAFGMLKGYRFLPEIISLAAGVIFFIIFWACNGFNVFLSVLLSTPIAWYVNFIILTVLDKVIIGLCVIVLKLRDKS